ncbi:FGGY family carbohydrate kinase [Francisella sp. 19X1-34]|uniref:FGGY-family carbohydrate kinase n=1 Tax=Francisella sp. 19X1-34 TaxID=3087177 RepID=UPI002E37931D|nr:FGGY family carbohydrate kinase [Francisella sp. 19X1-34]MED7789297.1 FGGY family carbohydrate kinase [Francisella sp. 19X1-34]
MKYYAILDIGKTHVKFQVLNDLYDTVFDVSRKNKIIQQEPYPHTDIESIWTWFVIQLKQISALYNISAINISAHGATAAVVDSDSEYGTSGLLLPIMDYEWEGVCIYDKEYNQIRPAFDETCSPNLPAGLNLGKQLFFLQKKYSEKLNSNTTILLYPQYWSWRMTGKLVSEITSLGCHTDLWDIQANDFSSLVKKMGWRKYFAKLHRANEPLGYVSKEFSDETGISQECFVFSGLHDSNASYLRYMDTYGKVKETIISTGTWIVSFSPYSSVDQICEERDTLVNIDIHGRAICCARFMGGREFEQICKILSSLPSAKVSEIDIQTIINQNIMALPNFSKGCGPFPKREPEIIGAPTNGTALAILYIALMINYELELLQSKNDVIIEGAFAKNSLLCRIIAQLQKDIKISVSTDLTGAVSGAASLCIRNKTSDTSHLVKTYISEPTSLNGLSEYYSQWKTKACGS